MCGAITRTGMKESERRMIRMLDNIMKVGNILWATSLIWLPVLLWMLKKKIPIVDQYLQSSLIILENIDDAVEMALLEFPNNEFLKTADDICDRVIEILKKAGYKISEDNKPKIETRVKSQLNKKKGWSVDWDTGELKVNYRDVF